MIEAIDWNALLDSPAPPLTLLEIEQDEEDFRDACERDGCRVPACGCCAGRGWIETYGGTSCCPSCTPDVDAR